MKEWKFSKQTRPARSTNVIIQEPVVGLTQQNPSILADDQTTLAPPIPSPIVNLS